LNWIDLGYKSRTVANMKTDFQVTIYLLVVLVGWLVGRLVGWLVS